MNLDSHSSEDRAHPDTPARHTVARATVARTTVARATVARATVARATVIAIAQLILLPFLHSPIPPLFHFSTLPFLHSSIPPFPHSPILQAQPVHVSNFPSGDTRGWTTPAITDPAFQRPIAIGRSPNGRQFLGEFGRQRVTFSLDGLPRHDSLIVELELFVIRSWDGNRGNGDGPDVFIVSDGDGGQLLRTTFSNKENLPQAYPDPHPGGDNAAFSGSSEVSTLGYAEGDAVYRIGLAYAHTGARVELTLDGDLRDRFPSMTNESWGVGSLRITAVPPRSSSATLVAGSASGAPGEQVLIPIFLNDAVSVVSSGTTRVRTTMRFNASMLVPVAPTPEGRIDGRERVVEIELPVAIGGDSSLGRLPFRVMVGDDTVTTIALEGSSAVDGELVLGERAGRFSVVGLCEAGGTRLFVQQSAVLLRSPAPNPVTGPATIAYAVAADGRVRLELIELGSGAGLTLVDGDVVAGEHAIALPTLPPGRYLARLTAPGAVDVEEVVVVR